MFAGGGGVAAELAQGRHPSAPTFTLPRLDDGSPLSLASLRGKAVVINFFTSWCPPCKVEAPALQRLYERYRAFPFSGHLRSVTVTPGRPAPLSAVVAAETTAGVRQVNDHLIVRQLEGAF